MKKSIVNFVNQIKRLPPWIVFAVILTGFLFVYMEQNRYKVYEDGNWYWKIDRWTGQTWGKNSTSVWMEFTKQQEAQKRMASKPITTEELFGVAELSRGVIISRLYDGLKDELKTMSFLDFKSMFNNISTETIKRLYVSEVIKLQEEGKQGNIKPVITADLGLTAEDYIKKRIDEFPRLVPEDSFIPEKRSFFGQFLTSPPLLTLATGGLNIPIQGARRIPTEWSRKLHKPRLVLDE